jgi:hypothetical protein
MKTRLIGWPLLLGTILLPIALTAHERRGGNPPPFESFRVAPSASLRLLLSDQNKPFRQ